VDWIDLDLPDVIGLRWKFYDESDSYRMIASSITDFSWVWQIPTDGKSTFVIAEGLLMYLHESEVHELLLCLQSKFPGCEIAFDAFSSLTAGRIKAHPSIQKTGATNHWGIDDPLEIEHWFQGVWLKEEWFFSRSPDIQKLGGFYRH
jgi:O-methyltransferase involved in polyketide biosynthesis